MARRPDRQGGRSRGPRPRGGTPVAPRRDVEPAPSGPGRAARLLRTFGLPALALLAAVGVGVFFGVRAAHRGPAAASAPDTPARTDTAATPASTAPIAAKTLFVDNCGFCHTLAAAGSTAGIGPNLDRARPTRAQVAAMIANGSLSGSMPANLLTGDDAARVAVYVAGVAGRR